jgi:hypothetical protein
MRIDAEVEDGEEVELGTVHNRVCRMHGRLQKFGAPVRNGKWGPQIFKPDLN